MDRDREREHLLRRNNNYLCPFGSELHILYLQDIQVAKPGRSRSPLAHYPERETPHRRHIGVVHSCRVRSTLYSVLGQSAWSGEWILKGLVSIALIVGIIWAGNKFFGLFREIDKESSDSPDKQ